MRANSPPTRNDTLAAFGSSATRSRASPSDVLTAVALVVLTPLVALVALSAPPLAVAAVVGALAAGIAMHARGG